MNSLDPWREQLRTDPSRLVAGVIEGWLDRGPWQRAEASDFLLDVADADNDLSEITALAVLDWAREKLTWDDRKRLRYGEIAHASQLADAFAVFQRLDAPEAAKQLADQHSWFESRTRPMRFDTDLDLHRLLWLATAFHQPDERFLARWLKICGQAARLSDGWQEWLRVGLTGLRKLKGDALPAEQQALAGLLLFHQRATPPLPGEAIQFENTQFEMLKELFPRGPTYWPEILGEIREQAPAAPIPEWLRGTTDPFQNKKVQMTWARPSREAREQLEWLIQREPVQSVWKKVENFFRDYYRYARHSGDVESLAKTVANLSHRLLMRSPKPHVLRSLLGWARLALDWDVGHEHLWSLIAKCCIAIEDSAGAENVLWEAIRRFPENTVCRNELANLLRNRGETGEAETLLRETMEHFPNDAISRNMLAELLRDRGETAAAETLLWETMEKFPDDAVSRNILAVLLLKRGETGEAETLLRDFMHNAHCRNMLAELLRDRGETAAAETLLQETMEKFPDDAVSRNILAVLLLKRGETERAETLLRKTMERLPDDEACRKLLDSLQIAEIDDRGQLLAPQFGLGTIPSDEERTLSGNGGETKTYDEFLNHILLDNISPKKQASGHGEMLVPQFGAKASPSGERATTPESAADLIENFDDPLTPWAAERAPVIRQAFGFESDEAVHERLRQAAQGGGAAELAEAALRLLFPEDVPPLAESLRARPNAHALRLLEAGQNVDRGMRIAEDAPETAAVLRALYRTEISSVSWQWRFRAAVLACADLSPPPIWANAPI